MSDCTDYQLARNRRCTQRNRICNAKSASREYEVQARSAQPVLLKPLIRLLRFGCLPLARIPRTENGLDHRHVFECILKRNRHVSISANCSGEDVALNRVLVADREVLSSNPATEHVAPVVNKDAAHSVIGSVKRDFDFDTALSSKEVAPLVGHELRAASKRRLTRRKIKDSGGQAVNLHVRVSLHQSQHA